MRRGFLLGRNTLYTSHVYVASAESRSDASANEAALEALEHGAGCGSDSESSESDASMEGPLVLQCKFKILSTWNLSAFMRWAGGADVEVLRSVLDVVYL